MCCIRLSAVNLLQDFLELFSMEDTLDSLMYSLSETKSSVGYDPVPTASVPPPVLGDDDDPRNRCLCGLMHVRTGVLAIAAVECLFFAAFTIATFLGSFGIGVNAPGLFVLVGLPAFTVCGLMIYGVEKKSRYFLVPHMTLQGLMIFACVVSALIFLISIARSTDKSSDRDTAVYTVATMLCVSFSIVQSWFLYVICLAFRSLADW